jgi:hypothetical protein
LVFEDIWKKLGVPNFCVKTPGAAEKTKPPCPAERPEFFQAINPEKVAGWKQL